MRESPSGSGLVTDVRQLFLAIADTDAPGPYFLAQLGGVGGTSALVPEVPGSEFSLISYGVQPRAGRLWRARVLAVTNTTPNNARVPTIFQWFKLGADGSKGLLGNAVAVPWAKSPNITTPSLKSFLNEQLDFGTVTWNAGDVIGLHMVLGGTDVGTPSGWSANVAYENVYAQRSPLAGP
jgi:hypothetical protein